jgi:hypothetical protein
MLLSMNTSILFKCAVETWIILVHIVEIPGPEEVFKNHACYSNIDKAKQCP